MINYIHTHDLVGKVINRLEETLSTHKSLSLHIPPNDLPGLLEMSIKSFYTALRLLSDTSHPLDIIHHLGDPADSSPENQEGP
jgi:hypothetical protein